MTSQGQPRWAVVRLIVVAFYIPIYKPLIRIAERITGND